MRLQITYRAALGVLAFAVLLVGTATAATARTAVAPGIKDFNPKSGTTGTKVRIAGTGLRGARVEFFGVAAAVVVNAKGTSITATVPTPLGETGGGPITVTTPGGSATSTATFTYKPPSASAKASGDYTGVTTKPRIVRFAPLHGRPGSKVTVTGANFGSVLVVKLGGVKTTFTSATTKIVAVVPRTATSGKITVMTKGGTAVSSASFTVG